MEARVLIILAFTIIFFGAFSALMVGFFGNRVVGYGEWTAGFSVVCAGVWGFAIGVYTDLKKTSVFDRSGNDRGVFAHIGFIVLFGIIGGACFGALFYAIGAMPVIWALPELFVKPNYLSR
ncbi:MAG: hypothetical protein JJU24_18125 [Natronohydrobacter sp.]|nr:hypothetical protein [Natronohydrobacter sp.]